MRDSRYLFVDYDLRGVLENQLLTMEKEVKSTNDAKLLNTSVSDMVNVNKGLTLTIHLFDVAGKE